MSTYRLASSWTSKEDESITRGTKSRLYFTELGYKGERGSVDNENNYKNCKLCPEKYEDNLKARIKIKGKFHIFNSAQKGYTVVNGVGR